MPAPGASKVVTVCADMGWILPGRSGSLPPAQAGVSFLRKRMVSYSLTQTTSRKTAHSSAKFRTTGVTVVRVRFGRKANRINLLEEISSRGWRGTSKAPDKPTGLLFLEGRGKTVPNASHLPVLSQVASASSGARTILKWIVNLDRVVSDESVCAALSALRPAKKCSHVAFAALPANQRAETPRVKFIWRPLDDCTLVAQTRCQRGQSEKQARRLHIRDGTDRRYRLLGPPRGRADDKADPGERYNSRSAARTERNANRRETELGLRNRSHLAGSGQP